jgi:hypothetical protein
MIEIDADKIRVWTKCAAAAVTAHWRETDAMMRQIFLTDGPLIADHFSIMLSPMIHHDDAVRLAVVHCCSLTVEAASRSRYI